MDYSITAKRALWLWHWVADNASKQALYSIPYNGKSLFRKNLDEAIKRVTGGGLLPQSGKWKQQPFHAYQATQRRFWDARSYKPGREYNQPQWKGKKRVVFLEELRQGQLRLPRPQQRISEMRPVCPSVGARLTLFWKVWVDNIADELIVDKIKIGYQINFLHQPPENFVEI